MMDQPRSWPAHALSISQLIGGKLDAVFLTSVRKLKLVTSTHAHFRTVQRYLKDNQLPFHTFLMKEDRPLKVVLRGLPFGLLDVEIFDGLIELNFNVIDVKPLVGNYGRPTGLWTASLGPDGEKYKPKNEIFSLTHLFYCRVHVRAYNRPRGPAQCHNCQQFGHGSSTCGRPTTCVRCGENHSRTACTKPQGERGVCANCQGPHNASYRGCKAFLELAAAQRPAHKAANSTVKATDVNNDDQRPLKSRYEYRRRRRRPPRNPANRRQPGAPGRGTGGPAHARPSDGDPPPDGPPPLTPAAWPRLQARDGPTPGAVDRTAPPPAPLHGAEHPPAANEGQSTTTTGLAAARTGNGLLQGHRPLQVWEHPWPLHHGQHDLLAAQQRQIAHLQASVNQLCQQMAHLYELVRGMTTAAAAK